MTTTTLSRRECAAIHEAAHIIACLDYGIPFSSVRLDRGGGSIDFQPYTITAFIQRGRRAGLRFLLAALAGPLAELAMQYRTWESATADERSLWTDDFMAIAWVFTTMEIWSGQEQETLLSQLRVEVADWLAHASIGRRIRHMADAFARLAVRGPVVLTPAECKRIDAAGAMAHAR